MMRLFFYGFRLPFGLRGGLSVSPREIGRAFGEGPPRGNVAPPALAVYVVSNGQGQCKVGVSGNPPARLQTLQVGNPHQLHLHYACYVRAMDSWEVEKRAHERLKHFGGKGEWFNCAPEDAEDAVIKAAQSMGKAIVDSANIPAPARRIGPMAAFGIFVFLNWIAMIFLYYHFLAPK